MNLSNIKALTASRRPRPAHAVLALLLIASLSFAFLAAIVPGASAAGTNYVLNGSFEKDADFDGVPNNWTGFALSPADKRVCNQSYAGSCSFKFVGDGIEKQLHQTYTVSGFGGDKFRFSVWTKGKNIVNGVGAAAVSVNIYYTAGDPPYDYWFFTTPVGTTPWTLHKFTVTADRAYDAISVIFQQYSAVTGKIWFDKAKLVPLP